MNIGIVGDRHFNDYELFKKLLFRFTVFRSEDFYNFCVVSGGCQGTDTLAEKFADEFGLAKQILFVSKEEWEKFGSAAGPRRNAKIVENSDVLIAFMGKNSKGTRNCARQAYNAEKPIVVISIKP